MASGTREDPWMLRTPPGTSGYTMYRDERADPPALVCQVGSTTLRYDARAVEDVAATAKKTCRELWQTVEARIGEGPWAIGERYSVADPYLLVYWMWGHSPLLGYDTAHDFPQWTAHARRLAARPAVQRAFASEGLALPT